MVTNTGDIPDRTAVEPSKPSKMGLLTELLARGETLVYLEGSNPSTDEPAYELHGYDTHVYGGNGVVYTQNDDEDECWFFVDQVISFEQH